MQHGPAASSGSHPKAPGSAGGYLLPQEELDRSAAMIISVAMISLPTSREGVPLTWDGAKL